MRRFVSSIAEQGRRQSPGFLVVPQNGEELLDDAAYVSLIDGLGKEDLLFGEFKEKTANLAAVIERRVAWLKRLTAVGKPVLAVEYLDDAPTIAAARKTLIDYGFVPYFADRDLGRLRFSDHPESAPAKRR